MEKHHPPSWASPTQQYVTGAAIRGIESTESRIESITSLEEWLPVRDRLIQVLESGLMIGGNDPVKFLPPASGRTPRSVSKHRFGSLSIENVIFTSMLGWEINATIFRPVGTEKLPGVICPTGSSAKHKYQYWSSAQLIARSGYVVCSYDPPGFVGERREGSDMFAHAPIGYLTGLLPRSFFVYDNAAAIDYIATRPDVVHGCGYGVTGLSLGAQTTVNAAIHDDRIKFIAPVCGLTSSFEYILSELYTISCIETLPDAMKEGLDGSRRLSLCAPTPCLVISGEKDEVFSAETTRDVFHTTRAIYELYGAAENIELYIDPDSGHTYSPAMVNQVVPRLDSILKGASPGGSVMYGYTADDVVEIPIEAMESHPDTRLNVCTLNAYVAKRLKEHRSGVGNAVTAETLAGPIRSLLRLKPDVPGSVVMDIEERAVRSWVHDFTRIRISGEEFTLPGVYVKRAGTNTTPGMVCVDEAGAWAGISRNGYLARAIRFLERSEDHNEPALLSIDAAGFGTDTCRYSAYDATSWSNPESTLAYVAFSAGTPVSGQRVRDVLAAMKVLEGFDGIDPDRLVIAGFGEGAVGALMASLLHGNIRKTILVDLPVSFEEIVLSGDHGWPRCSFIYNILGTTDIPELVDNLPGTVTVIRPVDAFRKPLSEGDPRVQFRNADIRFPMSDEERDTAFVDAVLSDYT